MGERAVLVKPDYLAAQMTLRDLDCAGLAREVNVHYGSARKPQVVSRQFISALRSGRPDSRGRVTRSCSPLLAQQIATVLGIIPTALFDMTATRNSDARPAQRTARKNVAA